MIYLFDRALQLREIRGEASFLSLKIIDKGNLISIFGEAVDELPGAQYLGCYHPDETDNFLIFKLQRRNTGRTQTFEGVHLLYDDLRGRYIQDLRPDNSPVAVYLAQYLKDTGWEIGRYHTNAVTSINAYYVSALEALSKLTQETGVIIRPKIQLINGKIRRKLVDVYDPDRFGHSTGRRFRHGFDGVEVVYQEDRIGLYTALIGRGAGIPVTTEDGIPTGGYTRRTMFNEVAWSRSQGAPTDKPLGQVYVEDKDATEAYGYPQVDGSMQPRIGIVTFDKIEDPAELLQATYKALQESVRPLMTFTVKRANAEGVRLGDKVIAIRGQYSFETHITEATHNLKNPDLTEYKFGDVITPATTAQLKKITDSILESEYRSQTLFANLQKQIDDYYWGEDGYNYDIKPGNPYGLPAGYYSFDRAIDDSPTKVIYQGAGKLLIANSKKRTAPGTGRRQQQATVFLRKACLPTI